MADPGTEAEQQDQAAQADVVPQEAEGVNVPEAPGTTGEEGEAAAPAAAPGQEPEGQAPAAVELPAVVPDAALPVIPEAGDEEDVEQVLPDVQDPLAGDDDQGNVGDEAAAEQQEEGAQDELPEPQPGSSAQARAADYAQFAKETRGYATRLAVAEGREPGNVGHAVSGHVTVH